METAIPPGLKNQPQTLGEAWFEAVDRYSDRPVFISTDAEDLVETPYRQAGATVNAWSQALAKRDIRPGDRVAFLSEKSERQILLFHALWTMGAVAVPISESLGEVETGFIIRDCEPKLIVVHDKLRLRVAPLAGDVAVTTFSEMPAATGDSPLPSERFAGEADDLACIIYTSGSTGLPKGVMLSHRNLLANAVYTIETTNITTGEVVASLLPYWHCFALVVEIVCTMLVGCAAALSGTPREFRKNISRYRPTIILVVPRIAEALQGGIEKRLAEAGLVARRMFCLARNNTAKLSGEAARRALFRRFLQRHLYAPLVFDKIKKSFGGRLRLMVSGGAPLQPDVQRFFLQIALPTIQGYGLTEASPVISVDRIENPRPGSCGFMLGWLEPANGGDYAFLSSDGQSRGRDGPGELLVKGDCVMKGYWRHRDESAKTVTDGWLHTGDIGCVEDNRLYIHGRANNMIVLKGGEKLHPEHIEDAIRKSPLVNETMVFGDGCKNVYAAVALDADQTKTLSAGAAKRSLKREMANLTGHLAPFQRPRDIVVLPAFSIESGTLTPTLKIRRKAIWDKYGAALKTLLRENGE